MTHDNVIVFPIRNSRTQAASATAAESNPNPIPAPVEVKAEGSTPNGAFDIRTCLPVGVEIQPTETSRGTTRIPHCILEFVLKATETKAELVVFLCLLRYTLGFQRSQCSASLSYIAEWTGLHKTGVRRGLQGLIEKGLIKRVGVDPSQMESAIYELPIVTRYSAHLNTLAATPTVSASSGGSSASVAQLDLGSAQPSPRSIPETGNLNPCSSQSEPSPKKEVLRPEDAALPSEGCSKRAQGGTQNEHRPVHEMSTKKERINKELKKNSLSDSLETYFSNIKPRNKRKRERNAFETLKEDYEFGDIADSLTYLIEKGIPGSGEKCHSPMAFLAYSIENVLTKVRAEREKEQKIQGRVQFEADCKRREAEKEALEESQYQEKVRLFEQAFPSPEAQTAYFQRFAAKFPIYAKSPFLLRNTGISAWFAERKQNA